jgi:hypothetical protein
MVLAKYHGADGILFIPGICERKLGQYTKEQQQRRIETIIYPACKLYGLQVMEVTEEESWDYDVTWPPYYGAKDRPNFGGYMMGWLRCMREPEPIMPSQDALVWARNELGKRKIVVHMRTTAYQTIRNSSADWLTWAKDRNAYVIEDKPITLDRRVALNELAGLNIGVNAGPMEISGLTTHRPYLVLKVLAGDISTNEEYFATQNWYRGDQYPWAGPHQVRVWNDRDDYEAIESHYQQWLANNPERELASGGIAAAA